MLYMYRYRYTYGYIERYMVPELCPLSIVVMIYMLYIYMIAYMLYMYTHVCTVYMYVYVCMYVCMYGTGVVSSLNGGDDQMNFTHTWVMFGH